MTSHLSLINTTARNSPASIPKLWRQCWVTSCFSNSLHLFLRWLHVSRIWQTMECTCWATPFDFSTISDTTSISRSVSPPATIPTSWLWRCRLGTNFQVTLYAMTSISSYKESRWPSNSFEVTETIFWTTTNSSKAVCNFIFHWYRVFKFIVIQKCLTSWVFKFIVIQNVWRREYLSLSWYKMSDVVSI